MSKTKNDRIPLGFSGPRKHAAHTPTIGSASSQNRGALFYDRGCNRATVFAQKSGRERCHGASLERNIWSWRDRKSEMTGPGVGNEPQNPRMTSFSRGQPTSNQQVVTNTEPAAGSTALSPGHGSLTSIAPARAISRTRLCHFKRGSLRITESDQKRATLVHNHATTHVTHKKKKKKKTRQPLKGKAGS